jgi:uncharacterized protein (DUF433 family)
MNDEQLLERIALNPKVMTGKPVIKGTRLTVEYIFNLLAHGATEEEILNEYEGLTKEDLQACYLFAAKSEDSDEAVKSDMFELKNALVKEQLLKKGSLERIPEPITDFTPYKNRRLFQIKGKPLSQTIIKERR